jgi:hypothetical protein
LFCSQIITYIGFHYSDSSVEDSSDEEVHDKDDDAFDEDKEDYMKEVSANEHGI